MNTLGSRLCYVRELRGLNQEELAKLAGVTQAAVSNLENRDSKSSSATPQLARALGIDAYWLATGEGAMDLGETLSPDEQRLMDDYRSADPAAKESLALTARAFASSCEIKNRAG